MVRKNAELARIDPDKLDSVLVAIDKDKGSQYALKWTVDHILSRGQSVTLLHVRQKSPSPLGDVNEAVARTHSKQLESEARELFLPFRCFCTRKDIKCQEVIVDDTDITKAIVEYATSHVIETLILGAPTRGLLARFKSTDVPSNVSKAAPDFCTVYVISKGKVSAVRSASAPAPPKSTPQIQKVHSLVDLPHRTSQIPREPERAVTLHSLCEDAEIIRSPFNRTRGSIGKPYDPYPSEMDISSISSGGPSLDRMHPAFYENSEPEISPRKSGIDYDFRSFGSNYSAGTSTDIGSQYNYSGCSSQDSGQPSWYSQNIEGVESEMRRLRLELKQTMDMYNTAYKEAVSAKQKTTDYQRWKIEEEHRYEEARMAEEAALALAEKEKAKSKIDAEAAQAAWKLADLEEQRRISAEMKALKDIGEKQSRESWVPTDLRYRRYTVEEIETATKDFSDSLKIGEGGYGPVYKCYLDHTEVAVKVLSCDADQGKSQFQQEVEVLSRIRHPNMVLLLGACPEYGCLVYEYMANGSLDDRIFRKGHTPSLPWQMRFRIAAEIATGLLFLHQTKPEPLVHRDLKPGNILLDRHFVSKISDVGLARLVPPSIANSVTQYRMTSTAGTFCYIDPEYQQTGMLGTKSDIYSLGIMLLQIITAKPPMGLAHQVESAIEDGTFLQVLDPTVPDWPLEETLSFAELALQCAELRKKDRPDLGKVILPELNRLRELADASMPYFMFGGISSTTSTINHRHISSLQETMSDVPHSASDFSSFSSSSSYGRRRQ
ncbi:U-box domain-containing protein 52 isoform X2 [Jatropha curcas]|uniref:U-box domain-containing protein 52 isoform X2 n=1 Tax=Jatropha curcas TaxID=180498 RepID=UPI0009D6EEF8|nr:U-box domain-containing protein 52 isoform X2 [Jatropha curcas]